jgi:hypothetical protein
MGRAVSLSEPAAELVAEPAEGTVHASTVTDVLLALCRNCEEDIWSGPGWDWEHFDNDERDCALDLGPEQGPEKDPEELSGEPSNEESEG